MPIPVYGAACGSCAYFPAAFRQVIPGFIPDGFPRGLQYC